MRQPLSTTNLQPVHPSKRFEAAGNAGWVSSCLERTITARPLPPESGVSVRELRRLPQLVTKNTQLTKERSVGHPCRPISSVVP